MFGLRVFIGVNRLYSQLFFSNTSLDQPYIPPVPTTPQPRQVILHKVKAGFGFQMRGANGKTLIYRPN